LTRVHTAVLKSGIQPSCAPQKLGAESTDAKFSPGSIERSPRGTGRVPMLIEILKTILGALPSVFRSRAVLLAENLVLRQQIVVLRCSVPKPRIRARDRVLFALAVRMFGEVVHAVAIV
jgi:hypothetical protein